jgi:enoyl-CoA hydratase/carnithine racemase
MDAAALADVSAGGNFSQKGRIRQTFPLSVPKPIIAAINGACAGIGLVQALMCDVRFASTTAKFSTAFSRRGLPAENAVAWVLGRLVGTGVAADLLLSGRVLGADEAWRIGLVNDSVAPDDLLPRAIGYASELAGSCSPRAMADIKAQLYSSLESGLEMARRESKAVFEAARSRPDFSEGVQSLVEKRPPTFAGFSAALDEQDFRD